MKTMWVIQKNLKNDDIDNMVKILEKLEQPYKLIDVIPFSEKLDHDIEYDGPIVAYGSSTLMRLAPKEWYPGVWYHEQTFKPSVWGKYHSSRYLNNDQQIMPLREILERWPDKHSRLFIRPDSDFKLFSGAVFMKGDFYDWYKRVEKLIDSGTYVNLNLETPCAVSEYKPIRREWRFFVAGENVLTSSQYRLNGKLTLKTDSPYPAYEFAWDIATDDYQLASAYVVDIAETKYGTYRIIEFNNFNSSGFYKCNVKWIIEGGSHMAEEQWRNKDKTTKIRKEVGIMEWGAL